MRIKKQLGELTLDFDASGALVGINDNQSGSRVHLLELDDGLELRLGSQPKVGGGEELIIESRRREDAAAQVITVVATQQGDGILRLAADGFLRGQRLLLRPNHIAATVTAGSLAVELEIDADGNVRRTALVGEAATAARFELDLFFSARSAGQEIYIGLPLQRTGAGASGFLVEFTVTGNEGAARVPLMAWRGGNGSKRLSFDFIDTAWTPASTATSAKFEGFDGRKLLDLGSVPAVAAAALIQSARVDFLAEGSTLSSGRLQLPFTLELTVGGQPFRFEDGAIELGTELTLTGAETGTRVTSWIRTDQYLLTGGDVIPLSLHFHRDTQVVIDFDPRDPFIALVADDKIAASAYLPALASAPPNDATLEDALKDKFVLDFRGEQPARPGELPETLCRITPGGARMTAEARPVAIAIAGGAIKDVQLEKGWMRIDRGDYELEIVASGRLGWFEKASGRLGVRASNRNEPRFAARFEPRLEGAWEDPSGIIEFRDPSAVITVALVGREWKVGGTIGGSLVFKRSPQWLKDAGEWLGELFEKAVIRFDGLDLLKLLKTIPRRAGDAVREVIDAVSLKFQLDDSWNIRLWRILKFDLTDFQLGYRRFSFGGRLNLTLAGGFSFSGVLPRLAVNLFDGVDIDLSLPLAFSGRLSTPAGIRAAMEFAREKSEERDRIAGRGTIAIPGWSEVGVACAFGKRHVTQGEGPLRQEKWIGLFFLFVDADIPVTLFPGVVLRQMGLGFGVNQTLRGFRNLHANPDGVLALMRDKRGLPDPSKPSEWEDAGGFGHTDLALVARTHVAPSPQGMGPFPYLADALVYIQPTSDFCLAFTSSLWLFTGIDDVAEDDEYRSRPAGQTVLVMYPRHGYLEARTRTLRNPKMKAAAAPVATALSIVQTEVWLKATPDLFMLRVGEMRAELKVPGFYLFGSMLYAVRAASGQVLALMRKELAGGFDIDWSLRIGAGPFKFTLGLQIQARTAYSLLLAGGYLRELGFVFYGRVYFLVSIELRVQLTVEFSLRIKIGWFKIHISWSFSVSASLSLCFEAQAEALVAQKGLALEGRGRLVFKVCGYGFDPTIDFRAGDHAKLAVARGSLAPLLPQLTNV